MQKDIERIADHFGMNDQEDKTIEECKELIQAIHNLRKNSTAANYENLVEEIADVEIMLGQMKYLHEIDESDLDFVKQEKIKRTIERYGIK